MSQQDIFTCLKCSKEPLTIHEIAVKTGNAESLVYKGLRTMMKYKEVSFSLRRIYKKGRMTKFFFLCKYHSKDI